MNKFHLIIRIITAAALLPCLLPAQSTPSKETQACLDCHVSATPGIVADWKLSRHAQTTIEIALEKAPLERRISSPAIPAALHKTSVGCYECHSLHSSGHRDSFEHFGFTISVVVSPNDCSTCHSVEAAEYAVSKKAHALDNLRKNPVYHALVQTVTQGRIPAVDGTCYACHGTEIEVAGMKTISTDAGDIQVPALLHWPNQGTGRVNPDGSRGSCTVCHARHHFSIEVARKPHTCGQCHLEPDVPAYNVYKESKHGNISESLEREFQWNSVPWTIGKDFTAPTCAVCHNSLLVSPAGTVIAQRTHDFGSRLWVRIFGLPYSHPQPASGKTYELLNSEKLPLPSTFGGAMAESGLIGRDEQVKRKDGMTAICSNCHSTPWAQDHFARLDSTNAAADAATLDATRILLDVWNRKLADKSNPFDEPIEQRWLKQWLFYANSVRYGAAMSGPDYAGFKTGWWELTNNLGEMKDWMKLRAK